MKIIDEGQHHITLQHPDGHQIKMAKSALSKQTIDKIKKFSGGGEVNYGVSKENTIDPDKAKAFQAGFNGEAQEPKVQQQSQVKNPQSQPVANMSDGGEASLLNQAGQAVGHYGVQPLVNLGKNVWNSYSGAVNNIADKVGSGINDFASGVINPEQQQQPVQPPQSEAPQATPAALSTQQPSAGPQNVSLNIPQASQADAVSPMISAAYAPQYQQAVTQNVNAYKQNASQQEQLANVFQTNFQALNQEHEKFKQDLRNGHIDPNRIFHDQGLGQKVSTAIGLLLGGLGGGLANQENPVMKFINSQIDRDIDAQKTDIGKNTTLLEDNLRQTGNLEQATNLTRLQHIAGLESKIGAGSLQMQSLPILQEMANQRTLMQNALYGNNANGGGGASPELMGLAIQTFLPKEEQAKALDELGDHVKIEQLRSAMHQKFGDINGMFLHGAFSPERRRADINELAGILGSMATHKYNQQEAMNQIGSMLPAKFESASTSQSKRQGIDQFFDALQSDAPRLNLLKNYGFTFSKPSQLRTHETGAGFKQAGFQK